MPPQTRASTTSWSASEHLSKCRVSLGSPTGKRPECMSKPILSVPKNSLSVLKTEPLTQPCPDGWSGNGGVPSGGVVGVDGWNSGSQLGSTTVSGLPSFAASWIAARGRQKCQYHLSFQQLIATVARSEVHHRQEARLVDDVELPGRRELAGEPVVEHNGGNCQKIAAAV